MQPTLIHLPPPTVEMLDRRASATGVSRAQVVRDAIAAYLQSDADQDLSDRVREAYTAQPLDAPDEWGDLDTFLASVRQQRDAQG